MTRRDAAVLDCAVRIVVLWLVLAAMSWGSSVRAASDTVVIPEASARYRIALAREVERHFGIAAPVARIGAQIHQESHWKTDARSAYAEGMSQFTPPTSAWLPSVCPGVGPPDPWDGDWSIRAITCYDAWLYRRIQADTECDRWAFVFAAYNGGLGWIDRDRAEAVRHGANPGRWWGHVERFSRRARWAFEENRGYPRRILLLLEPAYVRAGWPGAVVCS